MAQVLDIDSLENLFNSIRNKLKTQKTVNATLDGIDLKFYQEGNKLLAEYQYNYNGVNNTSDFEEKVTNTPEDEDEKFKKKLKNTKEPLYNYKMPFSKIPRALEDTIKQFSNPKEVTKDIKTFKDNGLYKIVNKDKFLVYVYNQRDNNFKNILLDRDVIKEDDFKKLVAAKKVEDTTVTKDNLDEFVSVFAKDYANENRIIIKSEYRNENEKEDENMELKYFFTTDADKNIIVNPEDYEDDFYVHAVTEDNIELKDAIDEIVEEHIKPNLIHVFDDIEDLEIKNFEFDNDENIGSFVLDMKGARDLHESLECDDCYKFIVPSVVAYYLQYGDEAEISDEDKRKADKYQEMGDIEFVYDELYDEMTDDFGFANNATTIIVHPKKNESVNESFNEYEEDELHIFGKRTQTSIPVALKTTFYPDWNKQEIVKIFDSEKDALDYNKERAEKVKNDFLNRTKEAEKYGIVHWIEPEDLEFIKIHGYFPSEESVNDSLNEDFVMGERVVFSGDKYEMEIYYKNGKITKCNITDKTNYHSVVNEPIIDEIELSDTHKIRNGSETYEDYLIRLADHYDINLDMQKLKSLINGTVKNESVFDNKCKIIKEILGDEYELKSVNYGKQAGYKQINYSPKGEYYTYSVDGKDWDDVITKLKKKIGVNESLNEDKFFKKELISLPQKDAILNVGDEVNIEGETGEIIEIRPMKMSDTCSYKIKLDNGKTIWRYEEEIINESKVIDAYGMETIKETNNTFINMYKQLLNNINKEYSNLIGTFEIEDITENTYLLSLKRGFSKQDFKIVKDKDFLPLKDKTIKEQAKYLKDLILKTEIINESGNVAYEVNLLKIYEDGTQSIYESEIVMTLKEAKKLAKEFIETKKDSEDLYIGTIEKGRTYWGVTADDFGSGDYVYGISNKSLEETQNILGKDFYSFDDIVSVNESKRRNEGLLDNNILISNLDYKITYNTGNSFSKNSQFIQNLKNYDYFSLSTLHDIILTKMHVEGLKENIDFEERDFIYDSDTGILKLENASVYDNNYVEKVRIGTINLSCKLWVHPESI